MSRYIIDANLPYYFSLWRGDEYQHVIDLDPSMKDSEIWRFAKENNLTIVTKDADFSDRILLSDPPPRVIHIKLCIIVTIHNPISTTKQSNKKTSLNHQYKGF